MAVTKTGFEQTTIEEIRTSLRDEYGVTDEVLLASKKTVLVQHLLKLQGVSTIDSPGEKEIDAILDKVEIDTVFDDATEESDDSAMQPYSEAEASESMPVYASEAWHEYVMKEFRDDELMDGAPTCDGCRRVVEVVLGPIVESTIPVSHPPTVQNNGTATVGVRIAIQVTNEEHPLCGSVIACEEIADVNKGNCDPPYYKYTSATASSRAEGRALRKLLRLRNVITAEEASDTAETTDDNCEWSVDDPVSDSQIHVMDMMCSKDRLNISVMDFINSGKNSYDEIHTVTKSTAQRMIQELNKFQRKIKDLPKTVGPYDKNWRAQK